MRIHEAHKHKLGYFEVRPSDVAARNDVQFVDVRDEKELLSVGHIHGVRHVPMARVLDGSLPLQRDAAVVLVCDNGRKSASCATALVRDHGFAEVYHLVGGMVRWAAEERPIARVRTYR